MLCDPCNVVYVVCVYDDRFVFGESMNDVLCFGGWRGGRGDDFDFVVYNRVSFLGVCGLLSFFFFFWFFHIENCCGGFVFLRILLFLSRSIWRDF